jgi:hypothetical protein
MVNYKDLKIEQDLIWDGHPVKVYSITSPAPRSEERYNNKAIIEVICNNSIVKTTDDELECPEENEFECIQTNIQSIQELNNRIKLNHDATLIIVHELMQYILGLQNWWNGNNPDKKVEFIDKDIKSITDWEYYDEYDDDETNGAPKRIPTLYVRYKTKSMNRYFIKIPLKVIVNKYTVEDWFNNQAKTSIQILGYDNCRTNTETS